MGSLVCVPISRDSWSRLNKIQEEDDTTSYKDILRMNLSTGDVRLIQSVWEELKTFHKGKIGSRIFELIFAKCPEIKNLFGLSQTSNEEAIRDARMVRHTIIFQDTLDMIMTSVCTDNDQLNSLLIAFGSQHSFYTRRGYDPKYWTVFGESLTELLNDLPTKTYQNRSMKHLWFRVMFFILASIRTGYTIGGTSKLMVTSSRRWWKESRRRHSVMESQLIDVLYVTDPVKVIE